MSIPSPVAPAPSTVTEWLFTPPPEQFASALGAFAAAGVCIWTIRVLGGAAPFHVLLGKAGQFGRTLDAFLVLRLARLFGSHIAAGRWSAQRRWGAMIGAFVTSAALGAFAPAPIALIALGYGLTGSLAVYRHWSWDEEDRASGISATKRRVPGYEDLTNEALLAIAALFLLIPLVLYRLNDTFGILDLPRGASPLVYVYYFLGELEQTLPLVGNLEVYQFNNFSGVQPRLMNGGHLAFMLRLGIDLVVIAAVLRAFDLWSRMATGQDLRRQEEALAIGDKEASKAAIEQLMGNARRGRLNAVEMLESVAVPHPSEERRYARDVRLRAAMALHNLAVERPEGSVGYLQVAAQAMSDMAGAGPWENAEGSWLEMRRNHGWILLLLANRLSGVEANRRRSEAADILSSALDMIDEVGDHEAWARTALALAEALRHASWSLEGERGERALDWARDILERALTGLVPEDDFDLWGDLKTGLGATLRLLGERLGGENGLEFLEQAAMQYRGALERPELAGEPRHNALHELGAAELLTARLAGGEAAKQAALRGVQAFEAAERDVDRNKSPMKWGELRADTISARDWLGVLQRENPLVLLETARAAVEDLRKTMTRESFPLSWARATDNLGAQYGRAGASLPPEQDSEAAGLLRQGMIHHDEALTVFDRTANPIIWAQSMLNRSTTEHLLALRLEGRQRRAMLEAAIEGYKQAHEVAAGAQAHHIASVAYDAANNAGQQIRTDTFDAIAASDESLDDILARWGKPRPDDA